MSNFNDFKKNGQTRNAGTPRVLTLQESRKIEKIAYESFVGRGCEHGHDKEDWASAERFVLG